MSFPRATTQKTAKKPIEGIKQNCKNAVFKRKQKSGGGCKE